MKELLVLANNDGSFIGAHIRIDGHATPVFEADLPAIFAELNASVIDRATQLAASLEAVTAELGALKETAARAAQAVVAVVDNPDVDDAQTAAACKQIAVQVLTPVRERDRQALLKLAAETAAKLAALG